MQESSRAAVIQPEVEGRFENSELPPAWGISENQSPLNLEFDNMIQKFQETSSDIPNSEASYTQFPVVSVYTKVITF